MVLIAPEDLLDASEVAAELGLAHRNSVTTYAHRYDDFPRPVVVRGNGRLQLWSRDDLARWQRRRAGDDAERRSGDVEQRERIVGAAHALMAGRRPGELTIRRIAQAAGVPHPAIYRHVESKRDLERLVVERAIREIWGEAAETDESEDWRATLPALVRNVLAHRTSVKVFVLAIVDGDDLSSYQQPALMARLLTALERDPGVRNGAVLTPQQAVAAAAALLVGAVVFEPRIEAVLRPGILTAEVLERAATTLLELALVPGKGTPA